MNKLFESVNKVFEDDSDVLAFDKEKELSKLHCDTGDDECKDNEPEENNEILDESAGTLQYVQIEKEETKELCKALRKIKATDIEMYQDPFVTFAFYRSNNELPIGYSFEDDDEMMTDLEELYGTEDDESGEGALYLDNGDINKDVVMKCITHAYDVYKVDPSDYINDKKTLKELDDKDNEEKAQEILDKFNDSEKTVENFTEALNNISKLEWDNEISKDTYDKYIRLIQDSFTGRELVTEADEDLVNKVKAYIIDDSHRMEDFTDTEVTEATLDGIHEIIDRVLNSLDDSILNKMSQEIDNGNIDLTQYAHYCWELNESEELKEDEAPDLCYSSLPSDDRKVIIIKRGESGYYPADVEFETAEEAKAFIDKENSILGVDDRNRRAMEIGSMFGWDVPGANPNHEMNESEDVKINDITTFEELQKYVDDNCSNDMHYDYWCDIINDYKAKCEKYINDRSEATNTDWKDEIGIEEDYVKSAVKEMFDRTKEGYWMDESSDITELAEDIEAFWNRGFNVGDKVMSSGAGEVEILALDKNADYILIKRNTEYDPFVAAWAPQLSDDKLSWGQGHYFNDEESARNYFNSKLNESEELKEERYYYGEIARVKDMLRQSQVYLNNSSETINNQINDKDENEYSNEQVDALKGIDESIKGYSKSLDDLMNKLDELFPNRIRTLTPEEKEAINKARENGEI